MATESPAPSIDLTIRNRVVSALRLAFSGLLATVGTLAVLDGVQKYLEYADGGVSQPTAYMVGVVAVLTVGFTLLLVALSGAIARGIELAGTD